jgi:heat shock protein HspQ
MAARKALSSDRLKSRRFKGIMGFRIAKFGIGQVVKHRVFPFRGVIFDVDPVFANTEEWWRAIPEQVRPRKDQPFYHLLAENTDQSTYIAYVSEQNLLIDDTDEPVSHPHAALIFEGFEAGMYQLRPRVTH